VLVLAALAAAAQISVVVAVVAAAAEQRLQYKLELVQQRTLRKAVLVGPEEMLPLSRS
jgi:hypothetical protein